MKIKKAVIPVAGFGTRFLPATKAVPKSLFPIVDTPVVHYLVEEAIQAGCTEIIFVLNEYQESIKTYFSEHYELEEALKSKNKLCLVETVHTLMRNVQFHYVYQNDQLGDGHAILCAKDYLNNEPFLVLFGDDLVYPPVASDLVRVFEKTQRPVIALQEVNKDQVMNYGVVGIDKDPEARIVKINQLVEKPHPSVAPSNLAIVGKYICTSDVFVALEKHPQSSDGEIRLIEGFKDVLNSSSIYGYQFAGKRYDIGNKFGFLEAIVDFALKREDLQVQFKKYLQKILSEMKSK